MGYSQTRRLVYLGLATGLAMALHIFEGLIPMPPTYCPRLQTGAANIITLYVVVNFGIRDAVVVPILAPLEGRFWPEPL